MTLFNGKGKDDSIPPKDKQYLDLVLEGKPDSFKVKIYEIVRRFNLDASDAAFLMMISSGRLEVLLEEFPDQFEALLRRELGLFQQEFRKFKQQLEVETTSWKSQAQGMRAAGDRLISGVSNAVQSFKEFATTQQSQLKENIELVRRLDQETRIDRDRELEKKLKTAQVEHLAAVRSEAETLIRVAGEKLKGRYLRQLIAPVTIAACVLIGLGGVVGWTLHVKAMGELDPAGPRQLSLSQWQTLQWAVSREGQLARNLIDWNQVNLYECIGRQGIGGEDLHLLGYQSRPIKYGICALWVVPPAKREFGSPQ